MCECICEATGTDVMCVCVCVCVDGGGDEMVILASACGITQVLKAQGTDRRRVARGTRHEIVWQVGVLFGNYL